MAFYDDRCVDPSGGLYQFYRDDGSVYDHTTRHLVSSTRFVVTHAMMARRFPAHPRAAHWRDTARHALRFVQDVHRDEASGGYLWLLRWRNGQREAVDATQHAYGLAFVLLAQAQAVLAGLEEARPALQQTLALMEQRFWEPATGLYADEAGPGWALRPTAARTPTCMPAKP
jgi:mannose/cellobiose epimerase-like protein (N-acyl-D-glucosamine 2-epimerase family)